MCAALPFDIARCPPNSLRVLVDEFGQGTQLHGGIGVTDEHDISLLFKRMRVLMALFGDEAHHVERFMSLPGFTEGL